MSSDATYITDTYHIVGDKAFPLKKYILTPYKKYQKRRRTRVQKIYNKHLASKRQVNIISIFFKIYAHTKRTRTRNFSWKFAV